MRRLPLTLVSGAAALLVGLVACGIPEQTDVQIDGRGPVADTVPAGGTRQPPPGRTASGSDERAFVRNFLTAAAGEASEAYKRVNEYIVADRQFNVAPADELAINIVRAEEPEIALNKDGTYSVTLAGVEQVGVLRANGSVEEPVATGSSYTFTVGPAPTDPGSDAGLYVLDPPPVVLMTTDALLGYYEETTVYFWNTARTALVPDLRYLPMTVPVERRATEVLGWLIGGPADWLAPTVLRLPDGTGMPGNVPAPKDGGRLEVNLSVKAGALDSERDLSQLFTQIAWSLQQNILLRDELELKIQNQIRKTESVTDYRRANPVYRLSAPERFAVLGGGIYPLVDSAGQPPPVAAAANRDIVSAGLNRREAEISAALVVRDGDHLRLRVGAGHTTVSQFQTGQPVSSMGRPVWLKGPDPGEPTGLVVSGNELYRFTADNPRLERIRGVPARVSSVGAALDGQRIAFIAGGRLHVATVRTDGGGMSVGPVRQLATSLTGLTQVDWLGENMLAVAGTNAMGRAAIVRLGVDGVRESPEVSDIGAPVTHLAAYPNNPVSQAPLRNPLYEANQVAYAAGASISRDQVSPGSGTLPAGSPVAPFFLY
ncbi:LpqB family beta-propeller domain-containing protein [Plantactinospora sp. CA-290183]|uniref:LpqB family beta-propeller domain-containing protein n=1 Tax=Plantactinospora sp. CA-290183 TaxID=3240006 RepID=UPI003D8DC0D3